MRNYTQGGSRETTYFIPSIGWMEWEWGIHPLKIIISNKRLELVIQTPWHTELFLTFQRSICACSCPYFKVINGADILESDYGGYGDKVTREDTE